jgi:hypothetical protein
MSDTNNTTTTGAAESLRAKMLALAAQKQEQAKRQATTGVVVKARPLGVSRDAFGSSPESGSGRLHAILAEAWACGVDLTARECAEKSGSANAPNHLTQGMTFRGHVMRPARGLWRLTEGAAELWHGAGKPFGFAFAEMQNAEAIDGVAVVFSPIAPQTPETGAPVAEVSPEAAPAVETPNAPQTASSSEPKTGKKGRKVIGD